MRSAQLLFIMLLGLHYCYSQTATYILKLGGIKVGTQTVTKTTDGDMITIDIASNASISFGFRYSVNYHQNCRYAKDILQMSRTTVVKNGETYNSSTTSWKNDHYLINHNETSKKLEEFITYSSSMQFFYEPFNQNYIYAEADCELRPMSKISNHTYVVQENDSRRKNEYQYKDGILQKGIISHILVDFTFELISYTP